MQGQELGCEVGLLETETSLGLIVLPEGRGHGPRFQRSRSGSRSRSKENCRANDNPSFFVKNCFPSPLKPAEPAPRAKRRNHHLHEEEAGRNGDSCRDCEELNKLLERSHGYILQLEARVAQLEARGGSNAGEGKTGESSKAGESERGRPKDRANLARLRQQIAETRTVERPSSQALAQQLKMQQAESLCLKQELLSLRQTVKLQEEAASHLRSKREQELEQLLASSRGELAESERREGQLRLEVGRLRLRESKQAANQAQARSEEVNYLRFRYEKVRRELEEKKRALESLQRRQEATRYLFPPDPADRELSLSLSP